MSFVTILFAMFYLLKFSIKSQYYEKTMTPLLKYPRPELGGGGGGGRRFAGYVLLAFQNPCPIIVYSVANYRPHLSHFWANVIVILSAEFNVSQLLNIKKRTNKNHFSTANLPVFKSLLTRIFLSQKSRKCATPF